MDDRLHSRVSSWHPEKGTESALGQVVERVGRARRDVHVGEETHKCRDDDTVDGETALGAAAKDGGRLAVARETVQRARRRVQVRVAGREGREEDGSIDHGRQALDARVLDRNDPRRSIDAVAVREVGVVGRHDEADDKGTDDVAAG